MRLIRTVLLAAFLSLVVLSAITYTACNKNHCKNVMCLNNGTCDGGNCVCPVTFEGLRCETLTRDKFIFDYTGSDSCGNFNGHTYDQYKIRLLTNRTDSSEMTLMGILNDFNDSAVCTIRSSDSFSFIGLNNSTTYHGGGKLRNDSLWLTFHVQHDTSSYECRYLGLSQK